MRHLLYCCEQWFSHGHTFGGNPLAAAAGLANLSEIVDRELCRRSREMGAYLRRGLEGLREFGIVGDIRGGGLLIGVEFVSNPATRSPFDPSLKFGVQVGQAALAKGLLTRFDPNWIALAPPLIVSQSEIDYMMDILRSSVQDTMRKI